MELNKRAIEHREMSTKRDVRPNSLSWVVGSLTLFW
jgi:hypothetical protein